MSPVGAMSLVAIDTPLERLQADFAGAILGTEDSFLAEIRAGSGLGADQRLGVYADAYRARLTEALQDSFAHTAKLLGEAAFRALALEYIEKYPSQSYSIRWYGGEFSAWLQGTHAKYRQVADFAAFDWALRTAFDSADAEPLRPADLAALSAEDWAQAGFDLHPSVQLLELGCNAVAVWQALDRDDPPPALQALAVAATVLVWRRDLQPHFRSLDSDEAVALRSLSDGASFAAVCARQAERGGNEAAVAVAGRWLRGWIDEALLVGLRR